MGKSRFIIVCALFSAIFALTPVHAKAQTFYEIEGVVEGPDATPLNGIAVFLEDLTRARVGQAITSSDGRYRFSRIVAGTYYIVVQPNNSEFRTAVRRIELIETTRVGSSTSTERVDIALDAMPRCRCSHFASGELEFLWQVADPIDKAKEHWNVSCPNCTWFPLKRTEMVFWPFDEKS